MERFTQEQLQDLMMQIEATALGPLDNSLSKLDIEVLEAAWAILDALNVRPLH